MRLQRELGARGVEFDSFTPIAMELTTRGDEIQTWLNGHRREQVQFVILDDDPNDEMGRLKPHLVKCDGYAGLTQQNCDDVVRMLTGPEGSVRKGESEGKTADLSNTQSV